MRAVRFYGRKDIRIDSIPDPECKPHEVIVAPAYCGICGSDLHEYLNGASEYPAEPHPLTGECVPLTLGHEFSGMVVKVGREVNSLSIGDRVTIQGTLFCGECEPCGQGNGHVCIKAANVGQHGRGGGLAELVACEESWCYKVPDNVGLDIGALCEPLSVSEHAIKMASPPPEKDQTALVLGAGAIGLGIIQLLHARGLTRIVVSEISKTRRQAAMTFGASHAFNPKEVDIVKEVSGLTDGAGAHLVFECSGAPAAVQTSVEAVRIRGALVMVALFAGPFSFDPSAIVHKEVTIRGSLSHSPADYDSINSMLGSESLTPRGMITQVVPLEKVVKEGIMALARADEGLVKILVEVNSPQRLKELLDAAR